MTSMPSREFVRKRGSTVGWAVPNAVYLGVNPQTAMGQVVSTCPHMPEKPCLSRMQTQRVVGSRRPHRSSPPSALGYGVGGHGPPYEATDFSQELLGHHTRSLVRCKAHMAIAMAAVGCFLLLGLSVPGWAEPAGPVAFWRFDEGEGRVAKDSSGNSNDGAIHGAKWVKGICGHALELDGKSAYVDCGTNEHLNFGDRDFAILGWLASVSRRNHNFVAAKRDWYSPNSWCITMRNTGFLHFYHGGGAIRSTSKVNDGVWHHFAFVRSGERGQVYIDGKLDGGSATFFRGRAFTNDYRFTLGGMNRFQGVLDEMMAYRTALTEAEIRECFLEHNGNAKRVFEPKPREIRAGRVMSFVAIGDPHASGEMAHLRSIVQRINKLELQPDFVMVMGDNAGLDNDKDVMKDIVAFEKLCSQLRAPHYYTLGNHEAIKVSNRLLTWEELLAACKMESRWYSFDVGDFHICVLDGWICMNSQGYGKNAGKAHQVLDPANVPTPVFKEQQEWFLRDLASIKKKVVVFIHQAIGFQQQDLQCWIDVNNWKFWAPGNFFEATFGANRDKIVGVFEGHKHKALWKIKSGIIYHQIAAAHSSHAPFAQVFIDPLLGTFYVKPHPELGNQNADSTIQQTYGDMNVMKRFREQRQPETTR